MKKVKNIVYIIAILFLTSCIPYHEPTIGNVKSFKFKGFKNNKLNIEVVLPINNPNKSNIIISEISLTAFQNNTPLGILITDEKIILKKNSENDYTIPVSIQVTNLMGGLSMLSHPEKVLKGLTFEGHIKARKGVLIKTLEIDKELSKKYLKF